MFFICTFYVSRILALGMMIFIPTNLASVFITDFNIYLPIFAIGFGACNGLTYIVPMQHGWLWYPKRPGLISGIIIGGFGIGTFCFNLVLLTVVNPNGLPDTDPDYERVIKENVPFMKLVFSFSNIASAIVSLLLIFPGPDATRESDVRKTLEKQASSLRSNSTLTEQRALFQTRSKAGSIGMRSCGAPNRTSGNSFKLCS